MSVEELLADIRADNKRETESKFRRLVKALARLGCSCTYKCEDTDLEAHECFCRYRSTMENLS